MRSVLPGVLLLAALLLAGCGADTPTATPIVIVVTATPAPPLLPTDTPVPERPTADIPATQAAATATQAADLAARATVNAEIHATRTAEALPTATAIAWPGVGGTLELADWRLSLAKVQTRDRLPYDAADHGYAPSGQFLLLWVDARNLANASRTLRDTLVWGLIDDHQADYDELWQSAVEKDQANLAQAILREGRAPLYANVTPRGTTHTLLIFDLAADTQPAWLLVAPRGETPPVARYFDLRVPAQ